MIVRVKNLAKIYQKTSWFFRKKGKPFIAVDGISFDLKEQEILAMLGPNGAGKTTTINMLLGLLKPTSGSIEYFGKSLEKHRSAILQHVGWASAYAQLPQKLTVREALTFFAYLYDVPAREIAKRFEIVAHLFGLNKIQDRSVEVLSAGQTTRVMLAKAFLPFPKVLLLDEPTASLDPDIAYEVRRCITHAQKEFGSSIILTSHNMDEVSQLADRVIVLKNGTIIAEDTPHHLAQSVSSARVHLIMGEEMLLQAIRFAQDHMLKYTIEEKHSIQCLIPEQKVAWLLQSVSTAGIIFDQISIETPSLEDYFIAIAKESIS